jgi:hypothetical protein
MYAILARDVDDFLELLPEVELPQLRDLYLMLSTRTKGGSRILDKDELNALGASIVASEFERRKEPLPPPISTKYKVTVLVTSEVAIVLKGSTPDEAMADAVAMAFSPTDVLATAKSFQLLDEEKDPQRPDTTICAGCGKQSLKTAWGPGWMKCPSCGREPQRSDVFWG